MRTRAGMTKMDEDAGQDVPADADALRLVAEILSQDRDLERSALLFRRDRLSGEARVRIPACAELPRFVSCTDWDHCFRAGEREARTRWVFDRRLWSVVVLHIRGTDGVWRDGVTSKLLDVTESLGFSNGDTLDDVDGWGCVEGSALPLWTAEATAVRGDSS